MKTLDRLQKLVEIAYSELKNYTKVYNTVHAETRDKAVEEARGIIKKDPSKVDMKTMARDIFYIGGFHQADIRLLQNKLLAAYDTYKTLDGSVEFSIELTSTVDILKNSLPKQIFIEDSGGFKEIVEGSVDTILKNYEDKNYFNIFEKQIKQLLDE